jgi:hypothetical protein
VHFPEKSVNNHDTVTLLSKLFPGYPPIHTRNSNRLYLKNIILILLHEGRNVDICERGIK